MWGPALLDSVTKGSTDNSVSGCGRPVGTPSRYKGIDRVEDGVPSTGVCTGGGGTLTLGRSSVARRTGTGDREEEEETGPEETEDYLSGGTGRHRPRDLHKLFGIEAAGPRRDFQGVTNQGLVRRDGRGCLSGRGRRRE